MAVPNLLCDLHGELPGGPDGAKVDTDQHHVPARYEPPRDPFIDQQAASVYIDW
jgi:hypothetical protein